jgi:tetratricopeptide (TPR) repeat protein
MDKGNEVSAKKITKVKRIVRYLVAAAASILLIFVCIEAYNFYRLSPSVLFNENYTVYELATTPDQNDSAQSGIEKAYREKNYAGVIKLNKSSVLSIKDIFLTGMSYLETNALSKAISSYLVVIADLNQDKNSDVKDAAEYYLALAYLKNNDFDQAIELMNKIRNSPSHAYTKKFGSKYIRRVKRLKWR